MLMRPMKVVKRFCSIWNSEPRFYAWVAFQGGYYEV